MAKITLATVKSFIKKNRPNLLISCKSHFDGMVDCVMPTGDKSFSPVLEPDHFHENNMNIRGAWFVRGGRDYFTAVNRLCPTGGAYIGYEVYNCCGCFELVIKE